jgi:hypothetical protein
MVTLLRGARARPPTQGGSASAARLRLRTKLDLARLSTKARLPQLAITQREQISLVQTRSIDGDAVTSTAGGG